MIKKKKRKRNTPKPKEVRSIAAAKCFHGTEFPSLDQWQSFDAIWEQNKPEMLAVSTPAENEDVRRGILEVATSSKLDR